MSRSYYETSRGIRLAYIHIPPAKLVEDLPAIMFLAGFKSDMEGTKAIYMEEQCKNRGQEFVRFDYSGHGKSGGEFIYGTIGSWKQDAIDIMDYVLNGRDVVLVGSSMGGWIALRILMEKYEHIKGVVGIAAAPDFTKDIQEQMGRGEKEMMDRLGRLEISNDYGDDPYIFTRSLLEEGEKQCVLDNIHNINVPLVLIQGKQDKDVPWKTAVKIKEKFIGSDTGIIFIEDGDHRLSREEDLLVIDCEVKRISGI